MSTVIEFLSVLLATFLAGCANGNMDFLVHKKDRIFWQKWLRPKYMGTRYRVARWMLRGSNARHKGGDPRQELKERFTTRMAWAWEMVWDGWHGSKTFMLGLLIIVYGMLMALYGQWWWALVAVPPFQLGFYLIYKRMDPQHG